MPPTITVTTWNVNSLPVRLAQVQAFLASEAPDVLALQETKVPDAAFPLQELEACGYHVCFSGQKSYNGVAVLSREPATDMVTDFPDFDDPQRRLLAVTIAGVRIVDVYIPNGQSLDSDKYRYKQRWLEALAIWLEAELARYPELVLLGDFNIAPQAVDMHDPARWQGRIMCSDEEQGWFRQRLTQGLYDTVRSLAGDQPVYSWWDYRMQAWRRNWGLRIDHILATPTLQAVDWRIGTDWRAHERPSDHAPVTVSLQRQIV